MRSRIWIAAVIALVIATAACTKQPSSTVPTQGAGESAVSVGDAAPNFTLRSASGGTVSLSNYAGKPVLLYFSMGPG